MKLAGTASQIFAPTILLLSCMTVSASAKQNSIWAGDGPPPNSADALHLVRGFQLSNKQAWERAVHEFRLCKSLDLLNLKSVEVVITTLNQAEDYDEALKTENYLLERITKNKSHADDNVKGEAYGLRASTLTSIGKTEQALSDFNDAAKFNSGNSGWYYYQAGTILRRQKHYQEAMRLFDKAIAVKCSDPLVEKSKAMCMVATGQEAGAIKYFNKSVEKITALRKTFPEANTPDLLDCYKALAACYTHENRLSEARDVQEKFDALTKAWQDTLIDDTSGGKHH